MRPATPLLFAVLLGLAACATYQPSEAKCFSLLESAEGPCDFELLTPADALHE